VDEQEPLPPQRVEGRREVVQVIQPVGSDRDSREARSRPADCERSDPAGGLCCELEDPVLPDPDERVAFGRVESLDPERRLQRDDGRVDLVKVEQGDPRRQLVISDVKRPRYAAACATLFALDSP